MKKFWERLIPIHHEPSEEAVKGLAEATRDLEETLSRGAYVYALSDWLDHRREENHFGDALEVSFKRRGNHA